MYNCSPVVPSLDNNNACMASVGTRVELDTIRQEGSVLIREVSYFMG